MKKSAKLSAMVFLINIYWAYLMESLAVALAVFFNLSVMVGTLFLCAQLFKSVLGLFVWAAFNILWNYKVGAWCADQSAKASVVNSRIYNTLKYY